MRPIQNSRTIFLCTLFVVTLFVPAFAQAPSLAPSDAYYATVDTEFGKETFTIIKDGRIEEQFYFVPARPHVAVETRDGKEIPVFQLLSFQRKAADNMLTQGCILQFSIQTGISKKTQENLLNLIKREFPLSDKKKIHRLSPIPMKDARISMYDLGGKMLDSAPIKEGVAPLFGNQQYPFMLQLTDLGSDVIEELCRGQGGLPVIITYTFQGMTEPGNFKVKVNWDACYKHFSTDTKLKAAVGYAMLNADMGANFSTIRDKMISNGMIEVTSLANEALPADKIDAAMNPILSLITKELFANIQAPPQLTPAAAKEIAPSKGAPNPTGEGIKQATEAISEAASAATTAIPYVGTLMKVLDMVAKTKIDVGASFALKDAKLVKKGSFTYTFNRQAIVERKTSFGGPIGIGSFKRDIQDKCITILPAGHWESAYFMLPPVGDPAELGFDYLNLIVSLTHKGKPVSGIKTEAAMFNRKGEQIWRDKTGNETSMMLFPLKSVYASADFKKDPSGFKFKVQIEAISRRGSVRSETEIPVFDGDQPIAPPTDLLKPVYISADCVSFGTSADDVFLIKGTLKADKSSFNIKLTEDTPNYAQLIPSNTKSLTINRMTFLSKTGKRYDWQNNGKDIKNLYPDLDIMLFDSDWQEAPSEDSISGLPQ